MWLNVRVFYRTVNHLIERWVCGEFWDFEKRGIHFRSLTEEINTATPGGKLVFHILGALAEFERGLIIERTREGMKAARARGVKAVRPPSSPANRPTMAASSLMTAWAASKWQTSSKSRGPPSTGRLWRKKRQKEIAQKSAKSQTDTQRQM
jgi:hypothetical protein